MGWLLFVSKEIICHFVIHCFESVLFLIKKMLNFNAMFPYSVELQRNGLF